MSQSVTLTADPMRVRRVLLLTAAAFFATSVLARCVERWWPGSTTANVLGFLDATRELAIPTFLTALMLLACAAAAALVARAGAGGRARLWWLLAAVLLVLGVDESVAMHEATIEPLRRALDAGGALYFTWVVPGIAFVAVAAIVLTPLVESLDRPARTAVLGGGALFVCAAIGLELAEGWAQGRYGADAGIQIALQTVEEGHEMAGVALVLYGLLLHLQPFAATVAVRART